MHAMPAIAMHGNAMPALGRPPGCAHACGDFIDRINSFSIRWHTGNRQSYIRYRPPIPVVEMPATIWRWKIMYSTNGGKLAITAAAIVIPRCT